MAIETIPLVIEFTGGLELLFGNEKLHKIDFPAKDENGEKSNVRYLVQWMCKNMMKDDREEMFVLDGGVRPGILVLINDADWELEGEADYELQPRDNILFVSTLHGG